MALFCSGAKYLSLFLAIVLYCVCVCGYCILFIYRCILFHYIINNYNEIIDAYNPLTTSDVRSLSASYALYQK